MGRVTAATAATPSLVEPLVAVVLAVLVPAESMPPPVLAGTVPLLGGLAVVSAPWPRRRAGGYDDVHATGAVKVEATTGERP